MRYHITTGSGRIVDPFDLDSNDLDVGDIAHSLACTNRFMGHTREPYSVAQHCCLVSDHCGPRTVDRLAGLLHDASEAYLGDVASPTKDRESFTRYRAAEGLAINVILTEWTGTQKVDWEIIAAADRKACVTEAWQLYRNPPEWTIGKEKFPLTIECWGWERAEREYLSRFYRLTAELACN